MLKRSGFKPPTPEKLQALNEKKRERMKAKQAPKSHTMPQKTLKSRRPRKLLKDGSVPKSERIKLLKKKLWKVFSQYIRLSWADHTGYLTTVDGIIVHWKECDCGHLWHNSDRNALLGGNELWWYENNFAPQSNQGNRLNADDSAQKYMLWATEKYGIEEVQHMRRLKETYKLWTEEEVEAKYQYYKAEVEKLGITN